MIGLVVGLVIWVIVESCVIYSLMASHRRCYEYAVSLADFSEQGRAYSDMATVIALDGKVKERSDA